MLPLSLTARHRQQTATASHIDRAVPAKRIFFCEMECLMAYDKVFENSPYLKNLPHLRAE